MSILNKFIVLDFLVVYCDAPKYWQVSIQNPATPSLEGMIFFHSYLMFFMIAITIFVCWMLLRTIVLFNKDTKEKAFIFTHSSALEIIWTILPALILVLIAIPSFTLLYSLDEFIDPSLTLKVIGHQWYWSYEYGLYKQANTSSIDLATYTAAVENPIEFDSYMVSTEDLTFGAFRLLEVDNRVVLPVKRHIRLLITAADVLHSWAVPAFGIKVDACPGRLSEAFLFIKRKGCYYGQCSEICGVNHGFMPIVVKVLNTTDFLTWYKYKLFTK